MVDQKQTYNKNKNTSDNKAQDNDDNFLKISLVNQAVFFRKKKSCPLKDIPFSEINYKNLNLLNKFLTERGKIIPSRVTNVSMKKQKALAQAIKVARQIALISPISSNESNQ